MAKFFLWLFFLLSADSFVNAQDAAEIIHHAEEKMRGSSLAAQLTITLVRPTWQREMKMRVWSKGKKRSIILVTAPERDRGTVFLKRDREVWNYLPSIERNVKLPPSMMTQSWMGTDFTNDDLVREASVEDDYTHTLTGDSTIDGRNCYVIRMIPKPDAPVTWGQVLVWIDKLESIQLRATFYDEDLQLVSTMTGTEIRELGGRMLPSCFTMIPADKPGNRTIMRYEALQFEVPLDDAFFSTQNMKSVR